MAIHTFTKNDTIKLKSVALLFMIIHHLFGNSANFDLFDTVILNKEWIFSFCGFAQICVGMYIFMSGYGLFFSKISARTCWSRILALYEHMWLVMLAICIPIALVVHQFVFSITEFIKNVTAINTSYCGTWWFVLLYVELLIAYFFLHSFLRRERKIIYDILIFVISVLLSVCVSFAFFDVSGIFSLVLAQIRQLLIYLPNFLIGHFFAKYAIFEKIIKIVNGKNRYFIVLSGAMLFSVLTIISVTVLKRISILYQDYVLVPLIIIIVTVWNRYFNSSKLSLSIILWFGNNSTWLWLIHGVLIKYIPDVIFCAKYPVMILGWIIVIQVPIVIAIDWIYELLKLRT